MLSHLILVLIEASSIVDIVNNDPTSTWVAVDYHPSIMSLEKLKRRVNPHVTFPRRKRFTVPDEDIKNALPEEFDSRQRWPVEFAGIRDQGDCGSCWAFAITTVVADRYAIKGSPRGHLSAQDLVSCDTNDYGCGGSEMYPAWDWMVSDGAATEECIPYVSGGGRVPLCPSKCKNGSDIVRHRARSIYFPDTELKIMQEIYEFGPVQANMYTFQDFSTYKSGIYEHKTGMWLGGHAVVILGWGVENNVPFWLCQNSWGTAWGENGYFRIVRGKGMCDIEEFVISGRVVIY
ncbi:putative Cathepsin B [Blattamonas nauphoetae]|uniref:Cathepsin B n=1 Tax=Blattamonas nauphoetae TaxID=2049346 RepID=A0ABQ9X7N0_9EUKA|nr:putative Cathepsin B [Blattamonas nauphoetae]